MSILAWIGLVVVVLFGLFVVTQLVGLLVLLVVWRT